MDLLRGMVALDCGNSSFRMIYGEYKNNKIESTTIAQFPNYLVKIGEYYYWDFLRIFYDFKMTLKELVVSGRKIDSIGICTWGVDFALFDKDGNMLSNPLGYRNIIGEKELSLLTKEDKKHLFYETGILCDKINSVYMLSGMNKIFPSIMSQADKCLLVPDVFNYFLTGIMVNEPSELSTTQLFSSKTRSINENVCKKFGISPGLFGSIGVHGEKIGNVKCDILEEIGADYDIPVICVPSHDTASAVAAIPVKEKNFGFISSGTWSLIGTELDEPIINDEIINANLTNEVGAFGKITLLKNCPGMFIVNQLKKEFAFYRKQEVTWDEISNLTDHVERDVFIDLDDSAFFNPSSMSDAIWHYLSDTLQVAGEKDWAIIFKAFYESLACCYAATIQDIEKSTGVELEKIYIVGGGTASKVLLNLTSEYLGKSIIVCHGESTSLGNLAVQLKYFYPKISLTEIREIIAKSYETKEIKSNTGEGSDVLIKYKKILKERDR